MLTAAARREISLAHMPANKAVRGFATRVVDLGHGPIPLHATKNLFSHVHATFRRSFPRLTRFFGVPKPGVKPFSFLRIALQSGETIQQRFSFSTRTAFSRPLRAAGIPRSPTMARPVQEVGLGTARKFSSQSTFKHVAENISITGRAFWSADWDVEEPNKRTSRPKHRRNKVRRQDKQSKRRNLIVANASHSFTNNQNQMDIYFPYSAPAVTTILQIALAPTPTATLPFSALDGAYIIPLRSILNNQTAFQATANDISAIFAKLDESNVWSRGVSIDTWGDTNGLCVELRIRFVGWSEHDVRVLLGELVERPACALQEVYDEGLQGNPSPDAPLEFIMPSIHMHDTQTVPTRPLTPTSDYTFSEFGSDYFSDVSIIPIPSTSGSNWGDTVEAMPHGLHVSLSASFLSQVHSL